ncbi:hypothetical protein Tco_0484978 [Tanacetum coccineum]
MQKGFPIFLAHVTAKEVEDKLEKKRLKDVPIVRDFPKVFPEDLLSLPPTRQVEFQIDLVTWLHAPVDGTLSSSSGLFALSRKKDEILLECALTIGELKLTVERTVIHYLPE